MKRFFILILVFGLSCVRAQNFQNGFHFYIPVADSVCNEFFPQFERKAITGDDFVTTHPDGYFMRGGEKIIFFGSNLVSEGCFADKAASDYIAPRIRTLGYNLIRLHHMDNPWSEGSLFIQGNNNTRSFNLENLDNLDYLIAQLKHNGVFINVNLHVSRQVKEGDGVIHADSLNEFNKGVAFFDPVIRELHKEFAHDLLTHVNPYTGKALVDDPVMAMVEVTNENSLYWFWTQGNMKLIADGGALIYRHQILLNSMWNQFLKEKYGTDEELRSAWIEGEQTGSNYLPDPGYEILPITSVWDLQLLEGASGTVTKDNSEAYGGEYCAKIELTNVTDTDWHAQWMKTGLTVQKDSLYYVSFYAKADKDIDIWGGAQKGMDPWTIYGSGNFSLTTEWQKFSFSFKASETVNDKVRLAFSIGKDVGIFYFDDMYFGKPTISGLAENESINNNSVKMPDYGERSQFTKQRIKDFTEFLMEVQNDYYEELFDYLRNDLGVKVPIETTNWNFGLPDLAVQYQGDFIDNHAYWDHPWFPNEPWSRSDWLINNQPMVRDKSGGTIASRFFMIPAEGKPYTISEYNHAFPNRYQSEGVLFITAYGAFHGLDGLMFFDFTGSNYEWNIDFISAYFSHIHNPAMLSLMPSCAYAFRKGYISESTHENVLSFDRDDVTSYPLDDSKYGVYEKLSLEQKYVSTGFDVANGNGIDNLEVPSGSNYRTDTGEIIWDTDGLMKVVTPKFIAATGFLQDYPNEQLGSLTLLEGNDHATFTMVSLTDEILGVSNKSLFTISTKVQNTGMIWDGIRTVHDDFGTAPTEMYPTSVTFSLSSTADSMYIYPLLPSGVKTPVVMKFYNDGNDEFIFTIDQGQCNSVWFGIDLFGENITSVSNNEIVESFALGQNYPNPFNPVTQINYSIPKDSYVSLIIYDTIGTRVKTIVDEVQSAGHHTVSFDGSDFASGTYFYELSAGEYRETKKMVLIK